MYLNNIKKLFMKKYILLYIGWFFIGFFFSWGNTSLGFIFLIIHSIFFLYKNKKSVTFKKITDKKIYVLLFIFLLWALFSTFFSYDKKIAFASLIGFFILISVTVFETQLLIKLKKFNNNILLPTISIGITISSSYIIYNYFTSNLQRAEGVFSNINDTGTILLVSFILIFSYFEYLNNKYKYFLLIPIILSLAALISTLSRGAFLGLLFGLAVYNIKSKKHMIVFLLVIVLIFSAVYSNPKLKNRFFDSLTIKDNMDRISIWISSYQMIKSHPIIGVGPGNFPVVYPSYRWKQDNRKHTMSFAHNIFLNMAVEIGIIGFILFSSIILLVLIMGIKIFNGNPLQRGVVSAFIAILVHNQFDCTVLKFEIGVIFWGLIGLIIAIYFSNKDQESF